MMSCFGYTQDSNGDSEKTVGDEKQLPECIEDGELERTAFFKLLISSVSNRLSESHFRRLRRLSTIFEASFEGDVQIPMCVKKF